jgi:chromosome segregation and condensation protein ScpB
MSRRQVIRAIDALKARGLIEVTARGTINGKPNTYRLRGPT